MGEQKEFDKRAAIRLKRHKHRLRPQLYRTIKGQILAGDAEGAMKGLDRMLSHQGGAKRE